VLDVDRRVLRYMGELLLVHILSIAYIADVLFEERSLAATGVM
jgi:hypothetical protein